MEEIKFPSANELREVIAYTSNIFGQCTIDDFKPMLKSSVEAFINDVIGDSEQFSKVMEYLSEIKTMVMGTVNQFGLTVHITFTINLHGYSWNVTFPSLYSAKAGK